MFRVRGGCCNWKTVWLCNMHVLCPCFGRLPKFLWWWIFCSFRITFQEVRCESFYVCFLFRDARLTLECRWWTNFSPPTVSLKCVHCEWMWVVAFCQPSLPPCNETEKHATLLIWESQRLARDSMNQLSWNCSSQVWVDRGIIWNQSKSSNFSLQALLMHSFRLRLCWVPFGIFVLILFVLSRVHHHERISAAAFLHRYRVPPCHQLLSFASTSSTSRAFSCYFLVSHHDHHHQHPSSPLSWQATSYSKTTIILTGPFPVADFAFLAVAVQGSPAWKHSSAKGFGFVPAPFN